MPGPAGLALAPFRGVRYAQERVSGLAEVTSPPYDVIGQDSAQHLRDADPHNVVRLILPRPVPGQPGAEYQDAARLLGAWLAEGILVPSRSPRCTCTSSGWCGPGRTATACCSAG